jgi:uncharacterized membrane protein HdeD (DUF308 family)
MATQVTKIDILADIAASRRYVADHWLFFFGLGIVLVLAGVAAIAFPYVSTLATKIFLGWLFLIGGAVLIAHAFAVRGWNGFAWSLGIGILYLIAGGYLAFFEQTGLLTLTILLAILFVAEGVAEIVMGVNVRPHDGWMMLILSGLIAIAAGSLIALGLPDSSEWALGLLTGINLLFTGWTYAFVALAARNGLA